jgi:hypothetical protein
MAILLGMDEAGYGPQLGPLAVAATAWEVQDELSHGELASASGSTNKQPAIVATLSQSSTAQLPKHNLHKLLRSVVSRKPSDRKIAIADSKALYKPGSGLRQLERGLHAVLLAMQQPLSRWSSFLDGTEADPEGHHQRLAWHDGFDCPLPVDATADELARCGERMSQACEAAGVRPLAVRARLVFPAEFNELCERYGSKGEALSHVTIGLLRDTVELAREPQPPTPSPQPPVFAVCDKHGGRNFYAALLQHHFPEHWIQPIFESRAESRYEWGDDERRMEVVFRSKGEEFLPTALASMTAKYLRELSMRAFNEFWCARVPNLRPTAGYPGDATRFRRDVGAMQRDLRIDDHVMWRNR